MLPLPAEMLQSICAFRAQAAIAKKSGTTPQEHVIVEQAGGRVSDFSGNPLDFTCGELLEKNTGIVATNGIIHEQVLEAIRNRAKKR